MDGHSSAFKAPGIGVWLVHGLVNLMTINGAPALKKK